MKEKLIIRLILFVLWGMLFLFSFLQNDINHLKISQWNIIFVLDVSNSMNVEDVFYNKHLVSRLEFTKKIIENNLDLDFSYGLVLFSNKFDYFIPPTKDKKIFKLFLDTVNTNNLDGGKTNFVYSINSLKDVLNPTDTLVVLSDFDTSDNLTKIDIKNPIYFVWIGTQDWGVVKNKDGKVIFKNGQQLYSKIWIENLKKLWNYYTFHNYEKWEYLSFLKDFKDRNLQKENKKIDFAMIAWFILVLLAV